MTHQHHHNHEPWEQLPSGFAEFLELEARLSSPVTTTAIDLAASALDSTPSRIVELGSGTGDNVIALAQRFPHADVHAVDISSELLDTVSVAATQAGVRERVRLHQADLNDELQENLPTGVDLMWASLTLHHINNPAAALKSAFDALRPGGILVVIEMTGESFFVPAGEQAHEVRHQASAPAIHHQVDWSSLLDYAGFDVIEQQVQDFVASPETADGAQYVAKQLQAAGEKNDDWNAPAGANEETAHLEFRSGRRILIAQRPHSEPEKEQAEKLEVDVAVIGGGAAGLAAAVTLGRSRREVVVIDDGHPRNAPAHAAHNVLGNEGISPHKLLATGREEAASYGVQFIKGKVSGISGEPDAFQLTIAGTKQQVHARRIVLATGLIDELPDIPGVQEGWGDTVLHCPFCHGWEVRDQKIAVLACGELAIHQVILFRQLSDDVTVFLHDAPQPSDEVVEQLDALNVRLVHGRVRKLVMDGTQVRSVQMESTELFDADAVAVAPRFNARTELFEAVGGQAEETPFGQQIPTNPQGMTHVPGVWAIGNAAQAMAMVVASAASGVTTGAAVHGDLAVADLNKVVLSRRKE